MHQSHRPCQRIVKTSGIGGRGSVAVPQLANPVAFSDGRGASFVAISGQIRIFRMAANSEGPQAELAIWMISDSTT
jgi:hypothetical protein